MGTNIGFLIICWKTNRSGQLPFTAETGSIRSEANSTGPLSLCPNRSVRSHLHGSLGFSLLESVHSVFLFPSSPPIIKKKAIHQTGYAYFPLFHSLYLVLQFPFFFVSKPDPEALRI